MSIFPTKILLATDGSRDAALAAQAAVDLSRRSGSELHVVHVWQGPVHSIYLLLLELRARELLDEQIECLEDLGATITGAHLRGGSPAEEITGLSEELGAGLLVVGSRGLGPIAQLVLGSVSEKIAYLASRPTLVVRGQAGAWPPARVVIGDDSSQQAKRAAEVAASIARLFAAQVFLVRTGYPKPQSPPPDHSWQSWGALREREVLARMQERQRIKKALEKRAGELEELLGQRRRIRAAIEDAAAFILEVAAESEEATLIAVGSRGLGTIKSFMLGSVSRKILRAASGPVLIAP